MDFDSLWEIIIQDLDFDDMQSLIRTCRTYYKLQYVIYDKHYFDMDFFEFLPKEKYRLIKNAGNVANFKLLKNFPMSGQ